MRPVSTYWSLLFVLAGLAAHNPDDALTRPAPTAANRAVAYFEAPKSVGTPIDDLPRSYRGRGLASRIAARIRLDTDASLRPATREKIRQWLAQTD